MNLKSNALHMAVGFLGMGAWAVFANRHHPLPQALLAGLVQGTMSAIITLFLKRMIEALSQRLPGLAGLILPPLLAVAASVGLLSLIHSLAGNLAEGRLLRRRLKFLPPSPFRSRSP